MNLLFESSKAKSPPATKLFLQLRTTNWSSERSSSILPQAHYYGIRSGKWLVTVKGLGWETIRLHLHLWSRCFQRTEGTIGTPILLARRSTLLLVLWWNLGWSLQPHTTPG